MRINSLWTSKNAAGALTAVYPSHISDKVYSKLALVRCTDTESKTSIDPK